MPSIDAANSADGLSRRRCAPALNPSYALRSYRNLVTDIAAAQ